MKLFSPFTWLVAATSLAGAAQSASALEISMVSGVYQSEKDKVNGTSAGGTSTIDAAARVAGPIDQHLFWFGEGGLTLRSYTAPANGKAPDDTTSLKLGGGVRYYFSRFSDFSAPFVYGFGRYRDEHTADVIADSTKESAGLFYGAAAGVRFGLDKDYFLDLEAPLFESALFATETTETTTAGVKTKRVATETDLHVNSTGALQTVAVALGIKL